MKRFLLFLVIGIVTFMCSKSDEMHVVTMEVDATNSAWRISYSYSQFGGAKSEVQKLNAKDNSMVQDFNLQENAIIDLNLETTETSTTAQTIGVTVKLDGNVIEAKTIYAPAGTAPGKIFSRSISADSKPQTAI